MSRQKPTLEQEAAVAGAKTGKTIKISAFAGSGKTSTLKLIAQSQNNKKFCYLAFNKAIAADAKSKFPQNVLCQTFHSLAFNSVDREITKNITAQRWLPRDMARYFGFNNIEVPLELTPDKTATLSPHEQSQIINLAINYFCRSAESSPNLTHTFLAVPEWIERNSRTQVAKHLHPTVISFWQKCSSKGYDFKISHDIYLKLWALDNPVINTDFILFDEAQDADPLMLSILSKQPKPIIFVGDKYQAIYGWRGAKNAMASVNAPEYKLTKSFRFGQKIADQANLILSTLLNETTPIIGNENIQSLVCSAEKPDAYLVRTNVAAFGILLDLIQQGRKPRAEMDITGLTRNIEDSIRLGNGTPLARDSIFFGFNNWDDVVLFVKDNPSSDITPITSLISKSNPNILLQILANLSQNDCDCVVSTAHKSKGLEFGSVYLSGDFNWRKASLTDNKPLMMDDEARLIYVAATRAINVLDVGGMSDFFDAVAEKKEKAKRPTKE